MNCDNCKHRMKPPNTAPLCKLAMAAADKMVTCETASGGKGVCDKHEPREQK